MVLTCKDRQLEEHYFRYIGTGMNLTQILLIWNNMYQKYVRNQLCVLKNEMNPILAVDCKDVMYPMNKGVESINGYLFQVKT